MAERVPEASSIGVDGIRTAQNNPYAKLCIATHSGQSRLPIADCQRPNLTRSKEPKRDTGTVIEAWRTITE
jgi:hypothetical protein